MSNLRRKGESLIVWAKRLQREVNKLQSERLERIYLRSKRDL